MRTMRNVTTRIQLSIRMTADDWQLYAMHGRETAARALSQQVQAHINAARTIEEAAKEIDADLLQFAEFGANDTEGRAKVAQLMLLKFGD